MKHHPINPDSESSLKISSIDLETSQLEYKRPLGVYKPHFEGLPDDYYPSSWKEVGMCIGVVLTVIFVMLGLMVLFILWDQKWGTTHFILLWSIIIVIFSCLLLIGIYFGGRTKIRNERHVIKQNLAAIQQIKNH